MTASNSFDNNELIQLIHQSFNLPNSSNSSYNLTTHPPRIQLTQLIQPTQLIL